MAAGVRCFVLVSRNVTGDDMAVILLSALKRIEATCREHFGAFIANVRRDGSIRLWVKGESTPIQVGAPAAAEKPSQGRPAPA